MSNTMKKQNNMGAGVSAVPPGFRFHPTDEELLRYYLKRKISCEPIDFDVIREVDLNKLEPWDLKEKCRIGSSGIEDEWYFFSHKDKKYPTGTRTNRATIAGFWKATGRDKPIHSSSAKKIGMRKTLVFYTGRAPRGHKTDWIMHEYRLDNDGDNNASRDIQEDGWVICRVTFKKKNQNVVDQEEPVVVNIQSSLPHFLINRPESTIPTSHPYSEDWLILDRLLAMDQRFPCASNSSYHHVFEPEFAKYSK